MQLSLEQLRERVNAIPKDLVVAEHSDSGHFYRYQPTGELFASVTTKSGILNTSGHLKKWSAQCAVDVLCDYIAGPNAKIPIPEDVQHAAVMNHNDIFKDAGDIGTQGHGVVERYMKQWLDTGKKPDDVTSFISPPIIISTTQLIDAKLIVPGRIMQFPDGAKIMPIEQPDNRLFAISRSAEKFFNDFDVEPVASELFVANEKDKYAGTLDSLLVVMMPMGMIQKNTFDGHKHQYSGKWEADLSVCAVCKQTSRRLFVLGDWKTSNTINKPEYAMQVSAYNKALWMMTKLVVDQLWIVRLDKEQAKYEILRIMYPELAYEAFVLVGQVYDMMNSHALGLEKIVERKVISLSELKERNGLTGTEVGAVRGSEDGDQVSGRGVTMFEV